MLYRALQTQYTVGPTPAIVIKEGSLVIGRSGHLTSTCDRRPLAAQGLGIPLNSKGWVPAGESRVESRVELKSQTQLQSQSVFLEQSGTRGELTRVEPTPSLIQEAAAPTCGSESVPVVVITRFR